MVNGFNLFSSLSSPYGPQDALDFRLQPQLTDRGMAAMHWCQRTLKYNTHFKQQACNKLNSNWSHIKNCFTMFKKNKKKTYLQFLLPGTDFLDIAGSCLTYSSVDKMPVS